MTNSSTSLKSNLALLYVYYLDSGNLPKTSNSGNFRPPLLDPNRLARNPTSPDLTTKLPKYDAQSKALTPQYELGQATSGAPGTNF